MSRDSRDRRDDDAALLTAYVDGVSELSPDERHRVEGWLARDAEGRADADAVKGLIDQLRALTPEGDGAGEPDWAAMERSIRSAVAAEPPLPWWRRWRWIVPAMTCVTAAAVLIVIWPRPHRVRTEPSPPRPPPAQVAGEPASDGELTLWLDGEAVDVDLSKGDAPRDVLGAVSGPAAPSVGETAGDDPGESGDGDEVGLLPATDLAWIDHLDAAALDRAERWLAGNKG